MIINLLMVQVLINSIQTHLSYCQKTKLDQNLIQGEIISTIRATELYLLRCAVPYIYIYINLLNINQFLSKTSELLSENKTLTKTLT